MKNLFHQHIHQDAKFVFQNNIIDKAKGVAEEAYDAVKNVFTGTTDGRFRDTLEEAIKENPELKEGEERMISFEMKDGTETVRVTVWLEEPAENFWSADQPFRGGIVKNVQVEGQAYPELDSDEFKSFDGIYFEKLEDGNYEVYYTKGADKKNETLTPKQLEEKILPLYRKRLEEAQKAYEEKETDAVKYGALQQEKRNLGQEVEAQQATKALEKDLLG